MIASSLTIVVWIASFFEYGTAAAPTWPSSTDELEDIMFLNTGYRARGFAKPVTPCTSEGAEGFISAAQWVRLAFHDMGTANVFTGVGGLDASIVYEMAYATNNSPGFNVSLEQFAPFFSSRSSMSDLIALSVYTSVRACGGPVVPIRGGRIDATAAGPSPDVFLPQPQNSLFTFENQFQRVGFNTAQMIAVVACGHTLGQVHAITFPQIATSGTKNLDSTPVVFDHNIAVEYIAGNSSDPLINGSNPAFDSDRVVFGGDGNVTIKSLTQPETFNSICSTTLQQMIEVVPSGVTLTKDPIVPYDIKPYVLQLTLLDGATMFSFTGQVRVRTTSLPPSQIASVQLVFVDRNGGNQCGSGGCTISTSYAGSSAGFDDSFVFYGFSSQIPTATSISAFNVVITLTSGATQLYNNNGAGFPVQDTIMLQGPESCLSPNGATQTLTVVAAVRNTVTSPVVNLTLTQKVRVPNLEVPSLQTTSVFMTFQSTIGIYSLFMASYPLNINQLASTNVKFDVSIGSGSSLVADSFKDTNKLPTACAILSQNISTTSTSTATSTSITSTSSTSIVTSTSTSVTSTLSTSTITSTSTSISTLSTSTVTATSTSITSTLITTTTSASATASAPPGWTALGCYADNVNGGRTLRNGETVPGGSGNMTVEGCVAACNAAKFILAGVEYAGECWCDNSLNNGGGPTPDGNVGCDMPCKGNAQEMCGGPNRLDMYSLISSGTTTSTSTSASATASTSTSTSASATASAPPGWSALGCYADNVNGGRTLRNGETVPGGSGNMTVEGCVAACNVAKFILAGVEYAGECWCDNSLNNSGGPAPDGNVGCDMPCKGNAQEMCGGPNRLDMYSLISSGTTTSTSTSASATASTSTSTSASATASAPPGWSALGCYADNVNGGRTLRNGKTVPGGSGNMTIEGCLKACGDAGFALAGVEFAGECWCDDKTNGGGPAPDGNAGCNMPCNGNTQEICGGPNRLDVYNNLEYVPTANRNITGYTYQGCYNEPAGGRALTSSSTASDSMTVESCASFCGGTKYFGVEYGRECYCGASLPSTSTLQPPADCSFTCSGNKSEYCGAGGMLNVYQSNASMKLRIKKI